MAAILIFVIIGAAMLQSCIVSGIGNTVHVSNDGEDSTNCMKNGVCLTLDYVLSHLPSNTTVSVDSEQSLNQSLYISNRTGVSIGTLRNGLTISVSTSAVITFVNCQDIEIARLSFIAAARSISSFLRFVSSAIVSIKACSFQCSGSNVQYIAMNDTTDKVDIVLTNFTGNNGLFVHQQSISSPSLFMVINNCTFTNTKTGSAFIINIDKDSVNNSIMVTNCYFHNNQATVSPGGHISLSIKSMYSSIGIVSTVFSRGRASQGGAMYINVDTNTLFPTPENTINITITDCQFSNNHGDHSAVVAYNQNDINDNVIMYFVRCNFTRETASTVNTMVSITYVHFEKGTKIPQKLIFQDCRWTNNSNYSQEKVGVHATSATIRTEVPTKFCGSTIISGSRYQTSLAVVDTVVYFEDTFIITNGGPTLHGGGIYLTSTSILHLSRDLVMTIQHTHAQYGGGIYYDSSLPYSSGLNSADSCIFDFDNDTKAKVYFNETQASFGGDAIFLNKKCTADIFKCTAKSLFPNLNFSNDNEINSSPEIFTASSDTGSDIVTIMLGQPLTFDIVALNLLKKPTVAIATVSLNCSSVWTNQEVVFAFTNGTFQTNLRLHGPSNASNIEPEDCILTITTDTSPWQSVDLHVNITQCPLGYMYSDHNQGCICGTSSSHVSSDSLICNRRSGTACIKRGFWYGHIDSGDNLYSVAYCYTGQCIECNQTSNCPDEFCQLPLHEKEQCKDGHAGPYCSICRSNTIVGYDGIRCIPRSYCKPWHVVLLVILYVVVWIVIIVLFVISLKLNLRIGCDYLYSFIYYFSVAPYVLRAMHQPGLEEYVNVISSMIQLNPRPLGFLPLCSIEGLSHIQHSALNYINPILMAATLFIAVQLAKRYKVFYLPSNSSMHGLCTLLLLMFTSLNETSLLILRPIVLSTKNFVFIQPNITYFEHTRHLPYAVMAIMAEIFFLIPFTILLLFSPCLSRWINFVRIKPILDNFQNCFHDNMRGMGGFYFLGRLVFLFVCTVLKLRPVYIQVVSALLTVIMLFIITTLQPYKTKFLNYLDGLMLLNLTVLQTLVYISWVQDRVLHTTAVVIIYILVILASSYGIALLALCVLRLLWRRGHCMCMKPEALKKLAAQLKEKYVTKKSCSVNTTEFSSHGILVKKYNINRYRDSILSLLPADELAVSHEMSYNSITTEDIPPPSPTSSIISINN